MAQDHTAAVSGELSLTQVCGLYVGVWQGWIREHTALYGGEGAEGRGLPGVGYLLGLERVRDSCLTLTPTGVGYLQQREIISVTSSTSVYPHLRGCRSGSSAD